MLLFRKKDRVKVTVHHFGADGFMASAYDGKLGVHNCYGSSREAAEEMARVQLRQFQERERNGIRKPVTHDFRTQARRGFLYFQCAKFVVFSCFILKTSGNLTNTLESIKFYI
jgi:hypothetical protein